MKDNTEAGSTPTYYENSPCRIFNMFSSAGAPYLFINSLRFVRKSHSAAETLTAV